MEKSDSAESAVRIARHNLRGRLNALKLCISALEILNDDKERLEFLDMIGQAANSMVVAIDELEAAHDRMPAPQQQD